MRQTLIIFFCGILIVTTSTKSLAQVDSIKNLTDRHWKLVKDAQGKFLHTTINFCSLNTIKSKYPKATKELSDKSKVFLNFLDNTRTIDSSKAAKIDSLNFSLLTSLAIFLDKLQKNKALFSQQKISEKGKKLEYEIQNVGRQIHDFNYWIYEKNGINIKFKDISL